MLELRRWHILAVFFVLACIASFGLGANLAQGAPVGSEASETQETQQAAGGAGSGQDAATDESEETADDELADDEGSTPSGQATEGSDEEDADGGGSSQAAAKNRKAAPSKAPQNSGNARTRLGAVNTRFTVYPGADAGGNLSGSDLTITPVENKDGISVTVGIDLSTSGSEPAKPGELEVLIPRSIFATRPGQLGTVSVSIPYPADGSGDWKYSYVDEEGNEVYANSDSCKYIKLVNNISIYPAHTQSMGIAYSVKYASDVVDETKVEFTPIVNLKQPGNTETKEGNTLTTTVDTKAEIAQANKSVGEMFTTWQGAWGDDPGLSNVFYVMYRLNVYTHSDDTQPYSITLTETPKDGGQVVGYMPWYTNNIPRDDAMTKVGLSPNPLPREISNPSDIGRYHYTGVLVAYPNPTTKPKDYGNTFTATVTPKDGNDEPSSLTGEETFTYKDIDLNNPNGEMYYLDKSKGWIANDAIYRREHGGIDRLKAGLSMDNVAYSIGGWAYQYTKDASTDTIARWGAEYTPELVDDMIFLNVDPEMRLGDGDYEITRVNPQWDAYEYHQNMTSGTYELFEVDYTQPGKYPELIAWGKSDSGAWTKIATFKVNTEGRAELKEIHLDGATAYNSETMRGGVNIPKGTGFTQVKFSVTANSGIAQESTNEDNVILVRFWRRSTPGGVLTWPQNDLSNGCDIYMTLYPTDKVLQAADAAVAAGVVSDEDDGYTPVLKVHNIDTLAVYTGTASEQAKRSDLKGAFLPGGQDDPNFKNKLHQIDAQTWGQDMWHKTAAVELAPYERDSQIGKKSTYENDPANNRVIIHYESTAAEALITHDTALDAKLVELGIFETQQDGVFYDLLPQGMTVDPDSIKATGCAADATYEVEYELVRNYKDSGRTLLIVRVHTDTPNWKQESSWNYGIKYNNRGGHTLNHLESGFTINYDGYYDWESLDDYGNTVVNYIAYESANDEITNGVDDKASRWTHTDMTPVDQYMDDLDETPPATDEDGNPIERPNFLYTNDSTTLNVVTQARYGLTKKITSPTVSTWTNGRVGDGENMQVGVPTGGQYQYRLRYASEPATTVKNMVLFDGLEAYEYIRSSSTKSDSIDVDRGDDYKVVTWQGTFESIDVSKIEAMGAKADVYYTTKAREELKIDDQSDGSDALVDGKLATCWTGPMTAAEINALDDEIKATITGLAIDMRKKKNGSDFELDSGKSVSAVVTMRAPSDPAKVRELVNSAQEQYDSAAEDDKSITNDKPYTYNAINMNAQVKEKGQGAYSEAHLITYEYTRAYLYTPKGNISIAKRITGMEEEEAVKNTFKVKATVTLPDGTKESFAGKYNRIDTTTGYYYTDESVTPPYTDAEGIYHAEGVFVNTSGDTPYYVTWDATAGDSGTGAWVTCDADGNVGSYQVAADSERYTFTTTDGQEELSIKGNQRIVLIDCDADLDWTVEEVAESAQGFRTSHMLNGTDGADDYTTEPFIIGDKNTARVIYRNMSTSELVVEKQVAVGDEDKPFEFTITITDKAGNEYLDWEGNPMVFDYVGEAEEGVEAPASGTLKSGDTVKLMHGQRIRIFVPGGTKYEVKETVPSNYEDPKIEKEYTTLVVEGEGEDQTTTPNTETSESDGSGTIKQSGDSAKEIFTNTHVPDEGPKKSVNGNDATADSTAEDTSQEGGAEASDAAADSTNEDSTHVDLGAYANPFTYTINQAVPIETSTMTITDTLEPPLEFVSSEADVELLDGDGNKVADNEDLKVEMSIKDQTLTAIISFADPEIKDDEGNVVGVKKTLDEVLKQAVTLKFVAKVREGADLAPYVVEDEESGETSIKVPNTAKVKFNNRPEVDSNTVTVTPPPPDEEIEKKVMGKEHYNLRAADEVYDYTIDVLVPIDATKMVVTDTLEPVLEFGCTSDEVTLTYNGEEVEGYSVQIAEKTLTVELEGDAAKAQRSRTLTVAFKARITEGADLAPYATTGSVLVPNKAAYQINNDSNRVFESEPVTVTPPPPDEWIEKTVMDAEHYDLDDVQKAYDYTIDVSVPVDANKVEITDTLEPVLNFANGTDGVEVLFGTTPVEGAKVSISGKTLTVVLEGDTAVAHRSHIITVKLQAVIEDGADLTPYTTNGTVVVPNTASYRVNNGPSFKSNTVTVTPPPEEPDNPDTPGKKTPAPKIPKMLAKTADPMNPFGVATLFGLAGMLAAFAWRVRREQ